MPVWPLPIPAWFWTWAQWYLGRDAFKGRARIPALRPKDAPTRIPPWAWARLALIVAGKSPATPPPPPKHTVRDQIVSWARWGVTNAPAIHYSEGTDRDDWLARAPGTLPMSTDCSGFATACYMWAGAPDPNGLGYKTLGFTGTLLDHGTVVASCLPGDLIVYGSGTGHHVVIALEAGVDPLCSSNGSEDGPVLVRNSDEAARQPAPVRRLRFLP